MFRDPPRKLPGSWEAAYWAILAIIFAAAIRLRMQLPSIPFLDFDSWDYLQPAIAPLAQGAAAPTYREFLYSWLLEQTLRIWPNFMAITTLQHSMGILSGAFLMLAWHRMRIFLPHGVLVKALHRVGGLLVAALFLFAMIIILDEHKIRPEAFFIFIVTLCLWLATEFSRRVLLRDCYFGFKVGVLAVCLIFLSSAAYFLRPYFGFAILCPILPVLIALILRPGSWVIKSGTVLCGLGLVVCLLIWPDHYVHSVHGPTGNKYFLGESLFCSSAEMVYDLVQKDAQILPASDPRRPIVENFLRSLNQVINHPSKAYAGFSRLDPDDVRYLGPVGELKKSLNSNEKEIKDCYYSYYFRAWKEFPLRMIRKIAAQLWFFYSPPRYRIYDPEEYIDVSLELERSKQVLLENRSYAWIPFQNYTRNVLSLQGLHQKVHIPSLALLIGRIMNATYSVSLLLTLIAAAALQFGWLKDEKIASRWALYLFSYNFGMSFTIAFVFVMGQRRYTYGQTPFSALSNCFALVFLLSLIPVLVELFKKRSHQTD